jgi:hypothetical protein
VAELGGRVGQRDQEGAHVVVDRGDPVGQAVRGDEQFAVHVDLLLVPGAVADPDRPAVAPAPQVRQGAFGEVVLDANHGFLFQYPHQFAAEVNAFLAA